MGSRRKARTRVVSTLKKKGIPLLGQGQFGKPDSWWEEFNDEREEWSAAEEEKIKKYQEGAQQYRDRLPWIMGWAEPPPDIVVDHPVYHRVTPMRLDLCRQRVILMDVQQRVREERNIGPFPVYHLWFPENDIRVYERREGNPPADCDRPKWLKGLPLWIDINGLDPETWRRIDDEDRFKQNNRIHNPFAELAYDPYLRAQMAKIASRRG